MNISRNILIFFNLCFYFAATTQTFPCDGRFIISLYGDNPPTRAYWIDLEPTSGSVSFNNLATYSGIQFNATAFNRLDNFLYGTRRGSNEIVRIRANGTYETVGNIPVIPQLLTGAGDCTPDGYYVYHEVQLSQLLFFEVVGGFSLIEQLDLYWDPASNVSGTFTAALDDIAFDPLDPGIAYAILRNYDSPGSAPTQYWGYLLQVDLDLNSPTAGQVTPVGYISEQVARHVGALFFDANGNLFGYGSLAGAPNLNQNRFLAIDKNTGAASVLGTGPGASGNDGCSCPYGLVFEKDATPRSIACETAAFDYNFTIVNRSTEAFSGVSFRDTLPPGMVITEISGILPGGTLAPGAGVGTGLLAIEGIDLPVGEELSLTVSASYQGAPATLGNQAFLSNLPQELGFVVASDDPTTVAVFRDPTLVSITPPAASEFSVATQPSANCLPLSGGILTISSPDLLSGFTYTLNYTGPEGTPQSAPLTADAEGQLTLTGLPPGGYTSLEVQLGNAECTLEIPGTFTIDGSTDIPGVTVTSNSPLCLGDSIVLQVEAPAESTFAWTGPAGFSSTQATPVIPAATASNGGAYVLDLTYGACVETYETEVLINAELEVAITGDTLLCAGEDLRLTATGPVGVSWSGPGVVTGTLSSLTLSDISSENAGWYVLNAFSGECTRIDSIWVEVFDRPEVSLPPVLNTNFCEPLPLNPEILASSPVTYQWSPAEGLSCSDCPAPALERPFSASYTLAVTNIAGCIDSAAVQILVDGDQSVYIPNAFSPNGDGINDLFRIYPGCSVETILQFKIFDRWGAMVFSEEKFDPLLDPRGWDGRHLGELLNPGVYTWFVEISYLSGQKERISGDVQLLR